MTGELHDAEDAAQEAFVRASVRWERIRRYEVPELWVRRVALHLTIDRRRATRRRLTRLIGVTPAPIDLELSDEALAPAAALRTLPLIQRQVLVLHYGLSFDGGGDRRRTRRAGRDRQEPAPAWPPGARAAT